MESRRITLEDGRYLIFYTFDDEPAPAAGEAGVGERAAAEAAEAAEPEAAEESGV